MVLGRKKSQNAPDPNEVKHLEDAFQGYHNRGDPWKSAIPAIDISARIYDPSPLPMGEVKIQPMETARAD
jgi:hypothetical protein